MRRALITTTVNVPTNLRTWCEVGLTSQDLVIVAGDHRNSHVEVEELADELTRTMRVPVLYLRPEDQERWTVSEALGWNCVQRRNIALLEALDWGADTVTTIDDDNYPLTTDFFERTDSALRGSAPHTLVSSASGWWNAGSLLDPPVTLRGFPYSQRHRQPELTREVELVNALQPGVVAHQVIGDPDVDAVERIVTRPEVRRYRADTNVVLASGTWCPFNSQATTYTRELAPLMFVWPGVGRYDDVWASYLAQRVMQALGRHVVFGFPLVRQDRNTHDDLTDLENELYGMRYTDLVVEVLRGLDLPEDTGVWDLLGRCFAALGSADLLPAGTLIAFATWLADLNKVL